MRWKKPRIMTRGFLVVSDTGIEPATSSVSGKRATAAPIAQTHSLVPDLSEVATGFEPVWTALQAAASPLGHATMRDSPVLPEENLTFTRADDEIRTRDPHLGKVMRYHCATSALPASLRALTTLSDALRMSQLHYAARQITLGARAGANKRPELCGRIDAVQGDWRSW